MARIKWEDRKYNSYFTMKGIGRRPKTRPDKDLRRRLGVLQFRASWKKLENYRKRLISRLGSGLGRGRGPGRPDPLGDYPDLREEAIISELRIMLDNLREEVSSNSPGGIKHLLNMIEEIIRLLSRVFNPSFPSLCPSLAGGNILPAAYPRGPPESVASCLPAGRFIRPHRSEDATFASHRLLPSPGPEFRIQTRPRI